MNEQEKFLCGKWLGAGIHRMVYVCAVNDTQVIKIANGEDGRMFNLIEAKIWSEVRMTEFAKWFAPIHRVSDSGLLLLMDRVEFGREKNYPKKVPHFFTDKKYNNYGWIGNRFVACDYANTIISGGFTKKLIGAKWWK